MISGKTRVLAVLGAPVTHSLSPLMHNAWLAAAGIDAVYVALPFSEAGFAALPSVGLFGANVTVPFKESAAAISVRRDEIATRLGAANVLRFDADGPSA
ncbi:MAG: shikimate dehydrogenase, partial [Alphaproteobacteria bacterium]|nr:shikimate dehydrogenase [Alphaproteobacteria bacterium]